ncbi:MAG: VOC family protein [Balneolaceae bacterium]|nr:VOC family protein [Balneolaceae bacterium]
MLGLFGRQALADDANVASKGSGFKGFALAHNLQSKGEVDQLVETLEMRGVNIIKPPHKTEWGGYSGYIADPEDNLWEIAYNPFWKYDEKGKCFIVNGATFEWAMFLPHPQFRQLLVIFSSMN